MKRIFSGNRPHLGISKKLHLCKNCKKVWEISNETKRYIYYENFPTYKLERKECKKCKKQQESI